MYKDDALAPARSRRSDSGQHTVRVSGGNGYSHPASSGYDASWEQVLEALRHPFGAENVSWKPQTLSRDRKRCLAVAYVDTQPYQERLDKVCPEWQDDYTIWFSDPQETVARGGDKLTIPGKVFVKCRLTLEEHTRTDVGECELTDENALTTAKAQAFKRACAAFGLGRYLYDLPKAWVDHDESRGIAESELRKLEGLLRRHAQGTGGGYLSDGNGGSSGNTRGAAAARGVRSTPAPEPTPATGAPEHKATGSTEQQAPISTGNPGSTARPARERRAGRERPQRSSANGGTAEAATDPAPAASTESGDGQEGSAPAEAPDEKPACPRHHVPLQLVVTREGKTLLLHKVEGEGYCNGEEVRPAAKA